MTVNIVQHDLTGLLHESLQYGRLFEIRWTERAENHKDRQYCPGVPTKFFVCVFCFAPEIGNAAGMPERSRSTQN